MDSLTGWPDSLRLKGQGAPRLSWPTRFAGWILRKQPVGLPASAFIWPIWIFSIRPTSKNIWSEPASHCRNSWIMEISPTGLQRIFRSSSRPIFLMKRRFPVKLSTALSAILPGKAAKASYPPEIYAKGTTTILRTAEPVAFCCPSKILQNQTDAFQAEWLNAGDFGKRVTVGGLRFLLFQNALCPAFIARFKNMPPQPTQHMIEFTAPKFNRDGLRQGIVTINPSSRVWLPLADILSATQSKTAPVVWKRRLWGTLRDQKLLDLLQSLALLKR